MKRNRRLYLYTEQTAETQHICLACHRVIEPGERYTRRRKRLHNGRWATLAKCSDCVPVRGQHDNAEH